MSYLSLCFLYLCANQISWCQETDHGLLALECTLFPPYLFIPVKPLPAPSGFFYLALFLFIFTALLWPISSLLEAVLLGFDTRP